MKRVRALVKKGELCCFSQDKWSFKELMVANEIAEVDKYIKKEKDSTIWRNV